jgi:TolA-binding protein
MQFDLNDKEYFDAMNLYLTGDYKKARASFERLVEKYPKSTALLLYLGDMCYSMGELEHALVIYKRATDANPAFGLGYYKSGVCAYRAGRLLIALENFQKVIDLREQGQSHAMANYFIGLINYFLGNDKESLSHFESLRKESPESKIANYYLAQLKMRSNDLDNVMALLGELVEKSPEFAEVYYLLGQAAYKKHDIRQAINYLQKALQLNPDDSRCKNLLLLLTDTSWP